MMPTAPRPKWLLVLLMFCFLIATCAVAQTQTATLSGVIQDPKGGVIPDVEVSVTRIETGTVSTTKTNGAGIYFFTGLVPGHYHLIIHKQGFKEIAIKEFELHVQDKLEQNFSLAIGSVSETVVVSTTREHMESDDPAVGVLVDRDFVANMPLNGRSLQDLIALAPGAVSSSFGTGLYSINGQHEDANYFTVDGVAANLNPQAGSQPAQGAAGTLPAQTALGTTQSLASVDDLEEFKIQTSGYTAEYGRQPGGQVGLTTRSGSNVLHGSLFEYFRNEAFDANNWFFGQQGIPKQAERQNDFGGTLGGPVRVPGLYNGENKTFFFVSYEGLRLKLPAFSGIVDTPTVAFRQIAAPALTPFLNATVQPRSNAPGNGDFCLSSLGPAYATVSCTSPWSSGFSNPSSLDSISARLDQSIGERFQLFLRYSDTPSNADSIVFQGASPAASVTALDTQTITFGMTGKLSATLLDELRFNYSTAIGKSGLVPIAMGGAIPYPIGLLIPPQFAPNNAPAYGNLIISIPNSFVAAAFQTYNQNTQIHQFNFIDSISWTHGTHAFKFGLDYRKLISSYNPYRYGIGLGLFSLAAVQQGVAGQVESQAFQPAHPIFNNLSLYAQDHWKVTGRLTLDYGLRWEFNPPPAASDGLLPLALLSNDLTTTQLAPRGTSQYHPTYHDFAPRLGFAYTIFGSSNHPAVLRGGSGIFFDTGQALGAAGYSGYPFGAIATYGNVVLPVHASDVAPPSLNVPLIPPYGFISANDPHLVLPYTAQWNLSLDESLSANNRLSISYVGNAGRKLLFTQFYGNFGAVNPLFSGLQFTSNAASSSYNALQIQDQGDIRPGLQVIASYTWAHAIDNSSTDLSNLPPQRGNSNNDVRQVFNAALHYKIPGIGSNRFINSLTHGWSLDNTLSVNSGYPILLFQGFYSLADGATVPIIPNAVKGEPIYLHNVPGVLGGWRLNPAAFSAVATDPNTGAPLELGDVSRNSIHGPAFWNLNTAFQRDFPLHERLSLNFRLEAFNIFNHPNGGVIDGCLCDSTFGQSLGTVGNGNSLYASGSPRSLQLMLRLIF